MVLVECLDTALRNRMSSEGQGGSQLVRRKVVLLLLAWWSTANDGSKGGENGNSE